MFNIVERTTQALSCQNDAVPPMYIHQPFTNKGFESCTYNQCRWWTNYSSVSLQRLWEDGSRFVLFKISSWWIRAVWINVVISMLINISFLGCRHMSKDDEVEKWIGPIISKKQKQSHKPLRHDCIGLGMGWNVPRGKQRHFWELEFPLHLISLMSKRNNWDIKKMFRSIQYVRYSKRVKEEQNKSL